MGWIDVISTGSGALEFRLSIEGCDPEWVTAQSMEILSRGEYIGVPPRLRRVGLLRDGIILDEQGDLRSARLRLGTMSLRIADIDLAATAAFAQKPLVTAWITADADVGDTNVEVTDTSLFGVGPVLHAGTEAMQLEATVDPTNFTVVRGIWDTIPQKHWGEDGENLSSPEITDRPATLEGRRCNLFVYGEGDDMQGSGTQIWVGIVATDPVCADGVHWELQIDPLTTVLQGDIGEDLAEPVSPRGIYYPWNCPLYLVLIQADGANASDYPEGTPAVIKVSRDFETQVEFCDHLTDVIATIAGAAGHTGTYTATPDGPGWRLVYTTPSASPLFTSYYGLSEIDGFEALDTRRQFIGPLGVTVGSMDADTAYYAQFDGYVPRGSWGISARQRAGLDGQMVPSASATYPEYRVYVGGIATIDADMTAAQIEWPDGDTEMHPVSDQDSTDRHVKVHRAFPPITPGVPPWHVYGQNGVPKIKFGREYGNGGSLADFIAAVQADAPIFANIGAVPFFTENDTDNGAGIATLTGVIEEAAAGRGFLVARRYMAFGGHSLEDFIAEECQLLGIFPCLNSSGLLTFRRLKIPVVTEIEAATLEPDYTLMDGGFPPWERNAFGMVNTVVIRTGYDPVEDDWKGDVYVVRDVTAFGRNKAPRTEEIKPFSSSLVGDAELTIEQIRSVASPILSVFGAPYETVTVNVPLTLFTVQLGDVIALVNNHLPDSDDGTRGWDAPKAALVIGRTWDFGPSSAGGTLTLMMHTDHVSGYAPTMLIESTVINDPGTNLDHTLTVSGTDPDGTTNAYTPIGSDARDFFDVGYQMHLYEWDASAPVDRKGTVTAVTATTVRVTLTAAWTGLGGVPYLLGFDPALVTAQRAYCSIAGADRIINYPGEDRPARVFGM